ncbi:aminoglycoside phosphotransferase family protein [Pseudalkalibacillus sp. Hm43]|uniref:aminoglycoside phosphotransferase family protein n=1 Tax=Pseudalkalibacillus sp. Hm43 TaxID=3450742 RepID=UPI003F437726
MIYPKTWSEWGKMYVNLDLWSPIIEQVLETEKLPYNEVTLTKHPGTHAVFEVDGRYILKIYTPLSPDDFSVEVSVYKNIAKAGHTYFPELVAAGEVRCPELWQYTIVSVVEGVAYRDVESLLTVEEKTQLAKSLATQLKEYHGIQWVYNDIPEWSLRSEDHLSTLKKNLKKLDALNEEVISEIAHFLQTFKPNAKFPQTVVHADLTEDHVFLNKEDGSWKLSGLIDVADSKYSSVLLELPAIWFELFKGGIDAMQAFMIAYDDRTFRMKEMRNTLIYMTFIHQFGADMIRETFKRQNITSVSTLDELTEIMWPTALFSPQSTIVRNQY